jgi:response regulator NasT
MTQVALDSQVEEVKTILICENEEVGKTLNKVLEDTEYKIIFQGSSMQEILSLKWQVEPNLIIAVMESSDNQVLSKFQVINEQYPLPIVIFTHDDREDAIEQAIQAGVSAYIVDGFKENRVQPILRTAIARFNQMQTLQNHIKELKTTLADRKIIDRAKGLIMAQRQCTEDEAYKLLRSSAMNQNMRLAQLAQNILNTANLLEPQTSH